MANHGTRRIGIITLVFAVIAFVLPAFGQSYQYDAAGRLTSVVYADSTGIAYTYDAAGNRLTQNLIPNGQVAPKIMVQPQSQTVAAGAGVTLSISVSGSPAPTYQWKKDGSIISGATSSTYTINPVQPSDAGSYTVNVTNAASSASSAAATLTVTTAGSTLVAFTSQPTGQTTTIGSLVILNASATATGGGPSPSYQWQKDGKNLSGATSGTLIVSLVQPKDTGLYTAIATSGSPVASSPAILGLTSTSKVIGQGAEVGANIKHPNGNIYDQVLMLGAATTITADPGQVTRVSFVDLSDDIVQVEFAGAGSLSIMLDSASGPSEPEHYNQTVTYMRGHAGIVIVGANETTNVSVFSVGRATAVNQALFYPGVIYDGLADIAYIAILSTNGKFGGIRTANTSYFATKGYTGIWAPGVQFNGPVFVGDINAYGTATPVLILGSASDTRITGGDLWQPNGKAVQVSGVTKLNFVDGSTSHGLLLPAQTDLGSLQQNGSDVTAAIVVAPGL